MKIVMKGFPSPVSKLYKGWVQGLRHHGDDFVKITKDNSKKTWAEADCYYQTNMRKPKFFLGNRSETQGKYFDYILDSKKPFIVSESCPFRKYNAHYKRFGWNSYKWHEANWNFDNIDSSRWNKFANANKIKFKDWHSPGDYILIMGQKEGDSALTELFDEGLDFNQWIINTVKEIQKYTDRKIVYRPHPRNVTKNIQHFKKLIDTGEISNVEISSNITKGGNQGGDPLDRDLRSCYCVVTYSSNSGVEAVEEGIPVFALGRGSVVHPIAHHDLRQIENLNYNIDVTDWQHKVAYTFWNSEELANGECWAHLKPVYFNSSA